MPRVARRGVRETWREAVDRQAGPAALAEYDAEVTRGRDEAEAAYRVLDARGLLALVDEPGVEEAPAGPARPGG